MTPNIAAFLSTVSHGEGTDLVADPYRCCYAKRHTIQNFAYHPHELRADGTREWAGETLTDEQCANVGLSPGCISSAAGRYQITLPTYLRLSKLLGTVGFTPPVQDDMAIQLIKERGALDLVMGGQVTDALEKCAPEWASLPGSTSGQPQAEIADLLHTYMDQGGSLV